VEIKRALPGFLKMWWLCVSPFAMVFAARIMWEKTLWTWSRGPQMVGFSLMHLHPTLAIFGLICSLSVMVWLMTAIPYAIARRRHIRMSDVFMMACAAFVVVVLVIPDTLFA